MEGASGTRTRSVGVGGRAVSRLTSPASPWGSRCRRHTGALPHWRETRSQRGFFSAYLKEVALNGDAADALRPRESTVALRDGDLGRGRH